MNLAFPDLDTLRLVITSQLAPAKVLTEAAEAVWRDDGGVIVATPARLPRKVTAELKRLGVAVVRSLPRRRRISVVCWHELLPLEPIGHPVEYGEQTPVLFELAGSEQLPGIVGEMLRLGNDRQSFRHLEGPDETRTLLRVHGPPYYTLLRALDLWGASGDAAAAAADSPTEPVTGYTEHSPRVWIELGMRHPLLKQLAPPAGQWLMISRRHGWQFVDEQPFRDIYDITVPELPAAAVPLQEAECPETVDVPLRLAPGSPQHASELWVVREGAMSQLEKLVRAADDQLLKRLAFCVLERGDGAEPIVVIRARPSRQGPPVLVLDATPYRAFARLKNLFVPIGYRLHPPLRRDTIAQLLAADATQLTWLQPAADGEFVPETAPDRAFRPLSDWVHYVLDHQRTAMATWIDSHQFRFDEFVCSDDEIKRRAPASKAREKQQHRDRKRRPESRTQGRTAETSSQPEPAPSEPAFALREPQAPVERSATRAELAEIEREFLESNTAIDDPSRPAAWRTMGRLNGALCNRLDTTVCFANALWDSPHPDEPTTRQWLEAELRTAAADGTSWSAAVDEWLPRLSARPIRISLAAASLAQAAASGDTADIGRRLHEIGQQLRRAEGLMPVRVAWLAWYSLFQISGDSLALARARDRVLERLFHVGLMPELNLPSFLRARGAEQTERYRTVLKQVRSLEQVVSDWVVESPLRKHPQTRAYVRLTFAFGLARLGESGEARQLLEQASQSLSGLDAIHDWLLAAYKHRIEQALRGGADASLPDELLTRLEGMDRMSRFKIDRLRAMSRIIEPHVRVDAFTNWHRSHADQLGEELASLAEVGDAGQLRDKLAALIREHAGDERARLRVLPKALEFSPRLGEAFAQELLDQAVEWLDSCVDVVEQALLLSKSLHIAAHFGSRDAMQALVLGFQGALPAIVDEYFMMQQRQDSRDKDRIDTIEELFTDSLHGLRKMGMSDEIDKLYTTLSQRVESSKKKFIKKTAGQQSQAKLEARTLRLQLCAASGWYFFGKEESARKIADQVRDRLFRSDLPTMEQRGLASAYANTVAQAGGLEALQRIEEMFGRRSKKTRTMDGIGDNMETATHFSISQLDVIEDSLLALVSEDFSLSPESRRWLDEDEYLIRRRIHEDVRREF